MTWLQAGFAFQDGLFLTANLANPGVGYKIKVAKNFSIQPGLSGGLIVLHPVLSGSKDFFGALFLEIRFCFKQIDVGFDYSRRVNHSYPTQWSPPPTYNYLGCNISLKF